MTQILRGNTLYMGTKSTSSFLHMFFHQYIAPETVLKGLEHIVLPTRTRTSGCITLMLTVLLAWCVGRNWHLLGSLHALKRTRQHVHGQPRDNGGTGLAFEPAVEELMHA